MLLAGWLAAGKGLLAAAAAVFRTSCSIQVSMHALHQVAYVSPVCVYVHNVCCKGCAMIDRAVPHANMSDAALA
jgi:hypothetical protein